MRSTSGYRRARPPSPPCSSSPPPHDIPALSLSLLHSPLSAHRPSLELAFRTTLQRLYSDPAALTSPPSSLPLLLDLAIDCSSLTPVFLDPSTPFLLLEDAFDYSASSSLPLLFPLLTARRSVLSSPALFTSLKCRLALVRMCNGLLRRVGKTVSAEWSGRVMELVAVMMPLEERGGLNLQGKFNVDNRTVVEDRSDAVDDRAPATDRSFYRTLWSLQAVLAEPTQLKQPDAYAAFTAALGTVLTAFERAPLSSTAPSSASASAAAASEVYFPKYLSGPRLLNLQLQDATFRRHLLTQCMLLFQFLVDPSGDPALSLTSAAPPNTASPAAAAGTSAAPFLSAAQLTAVRGFAERVLQLMEGQKDGDGDARYVQQLLAVLHEELSWMRWKQNKAPAFTRRPAVMAAPLVVTGAPVKGKAGRGKKGRPEEAPIMGGRALAELWAGVLSNEEAVRDGNRGFAPDVQSRLKELLDEDDDWQERKRRAAERAGRKATAKTGSGHTMTDADGGDDEEEPLDESALLRKNKQRQWTTLRLLRRWDFALFQKSDGSLDGVVEELKRRRKAEQDQAAKLRAAEPVKEETKEEEDIKPAEADAGEATEAAAGTVKEEEKGDEVAEEVDVDADADVDKIELEIHRPAEEKGGEGEEAGEKAAVEADGEDDDDRSESRRRGGAEKDDEEDDAAGRKRKSEQLVDDDDDDEERRKKRRTSDDAEADAADEAALPSGEPLPEKPSSSPTVDKEADVGNEMKDVRDGRDVSAEADGELAQPGANGKTDGVEDEVKESEPPPIVMPLESMNTTE